MPGYVDCMERGEKIMYGNRATQASAIGDVVGNVVRRGALYLGSKMLENNGNKAAEILDLVGIKVDGEKTGKAVAIGTTLLQLGADPGSAGDFVLGTIGDLAAVVAGRQAAANEQKQIAEKQASAALEQKETSV